MIQIINIIKKNAFLILALIAILILAILKHLKKTPTDQSATASDVLDTLDVPEQDKEFFNKRALDVAHHLGTAYPKWDPRYFTENDEEVFNLLKDLNVYDIEKISLLYFEVYAKGRTLKVDLAKLLDNKYYSQLSTI